MKNLTAIIANNFNAYKVLYLLFFLILPFVYNDSLSDSYLMPRQILLSSFLSILVVFIFFDSYKQKISLNLSFLNLAFFKFFIIYLLSAAISIIGSVLTIEGFYVFSKLLMIFLFLAITTYLLISNKLTVNFIIIVSILFLTTIIIFSSYQLIIISNKVDSLLNNVHLIRSSFGNKNLLASIIFLSAGLAINAFLLNNVLTKSQVFDKKTSNLKLSSIKQEHEKAETLTLNKSWLLAAITLTILSVILVWILQTKAVVAAIIISFTITLILILLNSKLFKKYISKKLIFTTLLGGLLVIILAAIITISNKDKFFNYFRSDSVELRVNMWNNALKMGNENILTGVGAGNFKIHFPKYGINNFENHSRIIKGDISVRNPHNDFLMVYAEQGLIGLLSFILIFISAMYYLFILIKHNKNVKETLSNIILFSILTGYLFISFVDFPFDRIEHQIFISLILSIIAAKYFNLKQNIYKTNNNIGLIVFAVIITSLLFSFILSLKRYTGEYYTKKASVNLELANWNAIINAPNNNYYFPLNHNSRPYSWYKGVAYYANNDYNNALTYFNQAYNIHPYNISVLNNLGGTYLQLNKHDEAINTYFKALNISSNYSEALSNLTIAYILKGQWLINNNRASESIEFFNKALINNDKSTEAIFNKAYAYSIIGNNELALENLYKAIEINPEHFESLNLIGNIMITNNDYEKALHYFSKAINTNNDFSRAYYNRANVFLMQKKYDEALKDYYKVADISPNEYRAYEKIALILLNQGKYELSLRYFNKTIELNPDLALAYYNRGILYSKINKLSYACNDWSKAFSLGYINAKAIIDKHCKQ